MSGYIDLHCHWVAGIDDGAPTVAAGLQLLQRLAALGFTRVIATPHMRVGFFDNTRDDLEAAYQAMQPELAHFPGLPEVALSSEHFLDDIVFGRLLRGEGLPYPGGRAVLVEIYGIETPPLLEQRLATLRRHDLLPVIAHPERYRYVWENPESLERLLDAGAAALLDAAALVGRYGRTVQRTAERLLDAGLYHAACSDAHGPDDVDDLDLGMRRIAQRGGREDVEFLFQEGPARLLAGEVPA